MKNKKAVTLLIASALLIAVLLISFSSAGTVKAADYSPVPTVTPSSTAATTDTASSTAAPIIAGTVLGTASSTVSGTDSVEVYGQGKVSINPDVAYVTLGYQNTNADPQKAQDDSAAQMDKIIAAVKNSGVLDADIQTSQYYVSPNYDSNNRTVKSYIVMDTINITIRDLKKSGSIIKAAYDSGANLFYGISFDLINRQDSYLQALDLAMSRAEEKAKKLAADSGRTIGSVVSIQEAQDSSSPYSYPYSQYSNFVTSQAPSLSTSGSGSLFPGQIDITAIVTVTYKLN